MRECGVDIEASPMGDGDDADWELDSERLVITAYYLPGTDGHIYTDFIRVLRMLTPMQIALY